MEGVRQQHPSTIQMGWDVSRRRGNSLVYYTQFFLFSYFILRFFIAMIFMPVLFSICCSCCNAFSCLRCLFDLHGNSTKFSTNSYSIHTVVDHRPVKNQTHNDQTTASSPQPDSGFIALVVIASLSGCAVIVSVVSRRCL